jgi:hypothetical protein
MKMHTTAEKLLGAMFSHQFNTKLQEENKHSRNSEGCETEKKNMVESCTTWNQE